MPSTISICKFTVHENTEQSMCAQTQVLRINVCYKGADEVEFHWHGVQSVYVYGHIMLQIF